MLHVLYVLYILRFLIHEHFLLHIHLPHAPLLFFAPPLCNRTQWKKCCFSGDGEYLVGGSYHHHSLYIWDQATWSLVKILTGQKGESLLDVAVGDVV